MKKFLLATLFGLAITQTVSATLPITGKARHTYRRFDQQFGDLLQRWHIPGASVAYIHHGHLYYAKGFGYANLATKQPVRPNALFRIASISKTITATAVLQLAAAKKLVLDQPIYRYLQSVRPLSHKTRNRKTYQITLTDLLHMSTGWDGWLMGSFDPMFGPWPYLYLRHTGKKPPLSCYDAARLMTSMPMQHQPNQKFKYANINFCLLGLAVSQASHHDFTRQSYVDYVQTHLFHPLQITDMRIASTNPKYRQPNEVHYYKSKHHHFWQPKTAYNFDDLPYGDDRILHNNYADGGWLASATDLAVFANGLYRHKLLPENYLRLMWYEPYTHQKETKAHYHAAIPFYAWPYSMGWFLVHDGKRHKMLFTHGSFTGSNAMLMMRQNGDIFVALFNKKPTGFNSLMRFRKQVMDLFLQRLA